MTQKENKNCKGYDNQSDDELKRKNVKVKGN